MKIQSQAPLFALDMIHVLERKSFSPLGPFSTQGSQPQLPLIEENCLLTKGFGSAVVAL